MITVRNILYSVPLALLLVVVLASCASDDDGRTEQAGVPIIFASELPDLNPVSRAKTTLGHDFLLYGYKNVGGTEQTVFDGYTIRYTQGTEHTSADNTHGYHYVEGEQSIKYWDLGASEYHFWGVWRANTDQATFSGAKNNVLTIHNVPLRTGDPAPEDNVLYTSLYDRNPVTADVVQLSFLRPYAKLRIQFFTTEPLDGDETISISGITFSPDPAATDPLVNKVYGNGDVRITYPQTDGSCYGTRRETVGVLNLTNPRDDLFFEAIQLTSSLGISSNTAVTAPIDESIGFELGDMAGSPLAASPTSQHSARAGEVPGKKYFYYPLPMGELNPSFVLRIAVDGDPKTTVVPATFMRWLPNYEYTYIFKITEAGKKIELYDVLIEPWHYGGSQDEEDWKNW